MRPRILVLIGPTAVGKTAVAISVAKKLDAEIISADSIQVYKGLNIGSAKPTLEERQGVVHHMLDVTEISDTAFSVAEFQRLTAECVTQITSRGKLPLVVGGTGLYINALTYPLRFTNVPGDETIRIALQKQEIQEPGSLHNRLCEIDPQTAARLHPNDTKRIVRALEIFEISGHPLSAHGSDFINEAQALPPYRAIIAGLTMDRDLLYTRIEQRVDDMMRSGLLEETKRLYEMGYAILAPALQGLGYKQLLKHLRGEIALDDAVDEIKRETRRFAKRQFTWFKRDTRIRWFDVKAYEDTQMLSDALIQYYKLAIEQDDGEGDTT